MTQFGYPAIYALFVWWFSTGVIILLDNLPARTFRWSMTAGTVLFTVSLHRLGATASDTSLAGAYAAFTYAVLAWGWQEMSFFMGYVTGPRRHGCAPDCGGFRHFRHGIEACLYHELAIIATAVVIAGLTWGAPNQVGLWTFLLLWAMRQSAKLNFFLGVLNVGEQFLPPHLGYLRSFMRKKPMNLLLPFSVTGGTVVATILIQRACEPGLGEARAAGLAFLITMLVLAVLEHWVLVLPLPFEKLWSWVLRWRRPGTGPGPFAPGCRHGMHATAASRIKPV